MSLPEGIDPIHTIKSSKVGEYPVFNRELSWLSFNHRVLQEAKDPNVPLYEKVKFLAIYSSNLDEFFRVRVGTLRHMISFSQKATKKLYFDPKEVHSAILKTVARQQEEFLEIFYNQIQPELNKNNIYLLNEKEVNEEQAAFVHDYFDNYVRPWSRPMLIVKKRISAFLKNNTLYLILRMMPKDEDGDSHGKRSAHYASLEIPTDHLSRWVVLPDDGEKKCVMFLDDVVRYNMAELFPGYDILEAKAVKLSRDADMPIGDEFSGNIVNKIRKLIEKRRIGITSRVLYDKSMSPQLLKYFTEAFSIRKEDLLPSDRYHNYEDLFDFPKFDKPELEYDPLPPIAHPAFNLSDNLMVQLKEKRVLLYYPFHSYDPVLIFLYQAARDPGVVSIKISLYRVAKDSRLIKALRKAAEKGKAVTVFAEVKARFDEMSNIIAGEKLEASGVNVMYSLPGLKVHSKLCMVTRRENGSLRRYCYLATGNFNEQTAKLYCDFGYFTDDQEVAMDIRKIFKYLAGVDIDQKFNKLIVSPLHMRNRFYKLIDYEIKKAKEGERAEMMLKMNSLEDRNIIGKLYQASQAGVKIRLIVRGICCLVPGKKGLSENIEIISIVDRFLEHARIYWFYHGGKKKTYLASADWMSRNLERRIETAFEIETPELKSDLKQIMEIQWRDNLKARIIDAEQKNEYVRNDKENLQSQIEIHEYLKQINPMVSVPASKVPEKPAT